MMFYKSIGAMASNRSIVESYANKMGWSVDQATAALNAYGSGLYLPTYEEVKAIANLPDFENEWRLALYAAHVVELQRLGHDLGQLAKAETVALWARGRRLLKPVTARRIRDLFGVDVDQVPPVRVFAYVENDRPKVWFDQRRNKLFAPGYVWTLQQVHDTMFVVKADNKKELLELDAALKTHNVATCTTGDFICAVIPATSASIYYAKP